MPLLKTKGGWTTNEAIDDNAKSYIAYTLIDVSNTEITDPELFDTLEYNQYQNLNTILQIIGLRTQPIILDVSLETSAIMKNFKFGSDFTGKHNVWKITFSSESNDPWKVDSDDFHFLKKDMHGVAFISELAETATFKLDVFDSFSAKLKNIYFTHG